MPQTTLFDETDLGAWLRQSVTQEAAQIVEKVVWGWLRPLLKVDVRPDTASDELTSWAIELGGIAYSNPEGLAEYQLESEKSQYSSERRDAIFRMVSSGGAAPDGVAPAPRGCFPSARRYPDPAERC